MGMLQIQEKRNFVGASAKTTTASFEVVYNGSPTQELQDAFEFALDQWAKVIVSDVPIIVEVNFRSLSGNFLASAGPTFTFNNFSNAPLPDTYYPVALANALSGTDLYPPSSDLRGIGSDIVVNIGNGFNWYYGTDGNTPNGMFDFVTIVMHEIGHGLGFVAFRSFDSATGSGTYLGGGYPLIYSRFIENGAGVDLLSLTSGTAEVGTLYTSNNAFMNSPKAVEALNGFRPKIYAPFNFASGSSVVHWDESTFPAGDANSLMTPFFNPSESNFDVGDITRGLFQDMGWTINTGDITPPESEPVVTSFTLINANTNEDILEISEDVEINLSEYPGVAFNIRANTLNEVNSVRLKLTGALTKTMTESAAPYALYGDFPVGDYEGQVFPEGSYTILGVPFSEVSGGGIKGQRLLINFKMVEIPIQRPFITTWKTDNPGVSADNQITIPIHPEETYDYSVDWGDGTASTGVSTAITHTYEIPGTYQVSISGDFPRIFFNNLNGNNGDSNKIITIKEWGSQVWTSMEYAFTGCTNLDILAIDRPDLTATTSMSHMFVKCSSLVGNESIGDWNTENITDMFSLFSGASLFNQDIGEWNVSNVDKMTTMFYNAVSFNQNIGNWNVANVRNMSGMFNNASSFNGNIGDWDVSKVVQMQDMFSMAISFNQDIGEWDVANVTLMEAMFNQAAAFNQDINEWNVQNVQEMDFMFLRASSFNQKLNNWNISSAKELDAMFDGSNLSGTNYDQTLIGWSSLTSLQNSVSLGAFEIEYCQAEEARQKLIDDFGWTITDGGKAADCEEPQRPFVTTWKTDNPGSSDDTQITIPTFEGETYDYTVNWGDGSSDINVTGDITHTYATPGTYRISISGEFPRIYFHNNFDSNYQPGLGDKDKLIEVNQWGDIPWTSMRDAFYGCSNMDVVATDKPDFSNLFSLSFMFADCKSMIGNGTFAEWNISNVSNISFMFSGAELFNQDIGQWNTSNVVYMQSMFSFANAFNQPIGQWDLSNATSIDAMFFNATAFNQDIGAWKFPKVAELPNMFNGALSFNQDISVWDVSDVSNFGGFLANASAFDQDLSTLDVSNATELGGLLTNSGLSDENYDKLLIGWSQLPSLQNGVRMDANQNAYCNAVDERQFIIDTYGWTINDLGQAFNCGPNQQRPFVTVWKTDNTGISENNQITIPTFSAETYNYFVDWGDGTSSENITGDITHTYQNSGTYTVSILGEFPRIYFDNAGDKEKLLRIEQWGDLHWTSMENAFSGCSLMDVTAEDVPDLSQLVSMKGMFQGCSSLVGNYWITNWDTSAVENMADLFRNTSLFNQYVGTWDVSNVKFMNYMFANASSFNQHLASWNVGSVESMDSMLDGTILSILNYDRTLIAWKNLGTLQQNVSLGAGGLNFCQSATARQRIIETYNWNIFDDMQSAECPTFQRPFITTWKTDNLGNSNDNQVTIPTASFETYDFTVVWGDGTVSENITESITHTYAAPGVYTVAISGFYPTPYFNNGPAASDVKKLLTVEQWGDVRWTTMGSAFLGCENLDVVASDVPDFSNVTSTTAMFADCRSLIGNSYFEDWDMSQVKFVSSMFQGAEVFNQDISNWKMDNVELMSGMFQGAAKFNQPIGSWNITKVRFILGLFEGATSFNQPLNDWDISNVDNLFGLFYDASSFNQPLDNWKVDNVTTMASLFYGATAFDQDLSSWNVSQVQNMASMFGNAGLSNENYDLLLNSWSTQALQNGVNFSAGSSQYCLGEEARQKLIDDFGWTIFDGGKVEDCEGPQRPFIMTWKTDNPGVSEDNQITLPTFEGEVYNFMVDWGDGSSDTGITGDITHTYANPGTYQVSISGEFPRIYDNSDAPKLMAINQWGDIKWSSMQLAFSGCVNLDVTADDIPDLSNVTSTQFMFDSCFNLLGNTTFNDWDTSTIVDMSFMFAGALRFNQPIGQWDTSNVVNMEELFFSTSFNRDISGWNTGQVTNMSEMFEASVFNQDISSWDVSKVESMHEMFQVSSFNQDISRWDVSNVKNMFGMFSESRNFNQNLGSWNVSAVSTMGGIFDESGLSNNNYDKILIAWSALEGLKTGVELGAFTNQYCLSKEARQKLIDDFGWIITDKGLAEECDQIVEGEADLIAATYLQRAKNPEPTGPLLRVQSGIRETYLKFDMSDINGTITEARLEMQVASDPGNGNLQVFLGSSSAWTETGLNGSNKPGVVGNALAAINGIYTLGQTKVWNLDVGNLSSDDALLTLIMKQSNGNDVAFASDETARAPKLFVTYSTVPEVQRPFITTWKTDNPGVSEDNQITIPTFPGETYNYTVAWGDGTSDSGIIGDITHTYITPGTYQVSITGVFPRISFEQLSQGANKVVSIDQWGDIKWNSMHRAFYQSNLEVLAMDVPDLSNVEDISGMFLFCPSLKGNESFGNWDTSNVRNMDNLFAFTDFNQDIGNWDTSNVESMFAVFIETPFNQDISGWDVSKVQNTVQLFSETPFNQNISNWDVSEVIDMNSMFERSPFDQDISEWQIGKVTDMSGMFYETGMSTSNYDATLMGWSSQQLQSGVVFDGGNSQYCLGEVARQKLIDDFGWIITDGGKATDCSLVVEGEADLIHATYLQRANNPQPNGPLLRVEKRIREAYLKFDLSDFSGSITEARLEMQVASDPGNGTVEVFLGSNSNWTETGLNGSNKPIGVGVALAAIGGSHAVGQTKVWNLDVASLSTGGELTLIVKQSSGNDVAFASDETFNAPRLVVTTTSVNTLGSGASLSGILSLSPNPAVNEVRVSFVSPEGVELVNDIMVYDTTGRLVRSVSATEADIEGAFEIDVRSLQSGIYFIRTYDENGIPYQKQMAIER
ncbi:MAG: hypothetical protein Mars2KO_01780 [Maribacter sp.]